MPTIWEAVQAQAVATKATVTAVSRTIGQSIATGGWQILLASGETLAGFFTRTQIDTTSLDHLEKSDASHDHHKQIMPNVCHVSNAAMSYRVLCARGVFVDLD